MARRLSWSDVRGGVIASVVIALLAFLTLKYSRLGALHGDTFKLYALVSEARGILTGSEVWLGGQKVGKVTGIRFLSPDDRAKRSRLEITMDVLERYRSAIRRDAVAQIRSGGSLIGAPVVWLTPGTTTAEVLRPGDTVRTRRQADTEDAAGQFSVASREFPVIINNVKVLAAQLQSTGGTIGAFMNRPAGVAAADFSKTTASAARVMNLVSNGPVGTSNRELLIARARTAMAHADSLRAFIASPDTPLSKARNDSTLGIKVADVRNELSIIRVQLDNADGTAGRVLNDTALVNAVHNSEAQMTALFADIKKHPFRYIRF